MTNNKKNTNKKSQMQISETIAILAVFFIIGIISFVIYFKFIKSNIEQEAEEIKDLKSTAIIQRMLSLPELQCSNNNIIKENCVDRIKLEVAISNKIVESNMQYYFSLFGFTEIKIEQVYPQEGNVGTIKWLIYSNKPKDSDKINKRVAYIPLTIHNPIDDKNYFGQVEISTYSK